MKVGAVALGLVVVAGCLGVATRPAAAQSASEATQRAPRDARSWTSLGDSFMQQARETADPAYYRRAEAAYRNALEVDPRHVPALGGVAWVQNALHEFEQAVEWATKALALDPSYAAAHGLLGDAALEIGEYDRAFEHVQKMLDLRPDVSSLSRGARILWLTGDQRKAIWMMGKAVDAGGAHAEHTAWARTQLALMLWSQGALLPAEQVLQRAREAAPANPQVLAAMAKIKTARKDYPAAIDHYRRAIAIVPQLDTVVALGDLYAFTGQKDEAEKQWALVETIDRLNRASGVRTDLEMAKFHADHDRDVPRALQEAEAVSLTRKTVYAYDALAWALYKAGRHDEARTAIRKALARNTPDAEILFHAGMIHAGLGDRVAAQKYLSAALNTNPYFHPAHAATAAATLARLGGRAAD